MNPAAIGRTRRPAARATLPAISKRVMPHAIPVPKGRPLEARKAPKSGGPMTARR
jgi:hypothetical protein